MITSTAIDLYAVFGNPVSHSKSPLIHSLFAEQTAQQLSYQAIVAPLDGFAPALQQFFAAGGKGCNVTVPFKEQTFALATQLTARAQLAGAVNTLTLTTQGEWLGDNTDGVGLVSDLQRYLDLTDKRVLLLGAGGAARGVVGPLLAENIAQLVIANRTPAKAQTLVDIFTAAAEYGSMLSACEFSELKGSFDIIINATSASLAGTIPPINASLIHTETLCYDMMYGAQQTAFNHWAEQQGAGLAIDGLGMLVGQAAESFAIWRGVKPAVEPVLAQLRQLLTE